MDYQKYFDAVGGEIKIAPDTRRIAARLLALETEARLLRVLLPPTPQPACYVKPLGERALIASLNPDTGACDLVRGDTHFSLSPKEVNDLHAWLDRVHPLGIGERKEWHEWDCSCAKCMEEMFGE